MGVVGERMRGQFDIEKTTTISMGTRTQIQLVIEQAFGGKKVFKGVFLNSKLSNQSLNLSISSMLKPVTCAIT